MNGLGQWTPLRRLCASKRMSRSELAKRADVSRQTVYNIEAGQTPSLITIFKLADALEMTPEALAATLGLTDEVAA